MFIGRKKAPAKNLHGATNNIKLFHKPSLYHLRNYDIFR